MENVGLNAGTGAFDRIFRAIGDSHRIQIMQLLREKEMSAGEILEVVDVVQSTLSHHMKTLSDAGVVNASRRGKWTYYSLNTDVLSASAAFLTEFSKGTKVLSEKTAQSAESSETVQPSVPSETASPEKKESDRRKSEFDTSDSDAKRSETPQKSQKRKEKEKDSVSRSEHVTLFREPETLHESEAPVTREKSEKGEKKKSKKNKKNKKNKK